MTKYIRLLLFALVIFVVSCSSLPKAVKIPDNKQSEPVRNQFDGYFYEAIKLNEEGKLDQAFELFAACYAIDSLDAGLSYELGGLYAVLQKNDVAAKFLERAYHADPSNWWYNMQLLSVYANLNKMDELTLLAENMQKQFPYKQEVYEILGSLYKQTNQFQKAINAIDRLENMAGIDERLTLEKYELYNQLKKPAKGMAEIDKLIQKYPGESRYKVLKGDALRDLSMQDQAFQIYNEVLASDPENPQVYVSLSDYYNDAGQQEKASEAIMKALKLDQLELDQKMEILGQYVQKFIQDSVRFNETESLFKLLVDKYPLEEKVHGYYALFLQFRKRIPEAVAEYESMININPKNEQTWLQLIQIYVSEQKFNDVLKTSNSAIENIPTIPQWYFFKGISLFQLKDYPGALKAVYQGIELIPDKENGLKSDLYAQAGDIYYKLEDKPKAYEAYENALLANPKNIYVMNNYAYFLSEENRDLKKAEKMSAQTVEKEPSNSTYLDTYAWIFYKQGNLSLAKFYIERAMDNLAPEHDPGVVMEHYGDILWKSGETEKALEMWKKSYDAGNITDELKLKIDNKELK
ncbi:MAG: Tetratricopeptide 1 repeat-containing protein [Bacteroidetes bacterium]|nr:Tetratricopeptide 1 repeat-containing protein [Bacteroidota bacterium]